MQRPRQCVPYQPNAPRRRPITCVRRQPQHRGTHEWLRGHPRARADVQRVRGSEPVRARLQGFEPAPCARWSRTEPRRIVHQPTTRAFRIPTEDPGGMRIVFATADPFSQVNWLCIRLPASDPRPAPSRVGLFAVPPQRWNIRLGCYRCPLLRPRRRPPLRSGHRPP